MKQPIFFERNRVGRVYTGGKLFAGFFGDEPVDNFLPEEWIRKFRQEVAEEVVVGGIMSVEMGGECVVCP